MYKRLLRVLKRSNYKYFRVVTRCGYTRELLSEELITFSGLSLRIKNYSKDFEKGLINVNDIDDISVPYLASFTIEDLRDLTDTKDVFFEGVVVEER